MSTEERVAALEVRAQKIDALEERTARIGALEARAQTQEELLKDINTKVTELSNQFLKHKGFIGGVIFTITALWTIIALSITVFFKR